MAEEFASKIQENPDGKWFVDDLVNYVMLRNSPRYTVEREPVLFNTFLYREIIEEKFKEIVRRIESHKEMSGSLVCRNTNVTPSGYAALVKRLEDRAFDRGFSVTLFLIHCAHISTIAALFYNEGVDSAPELAKSHIVELLTRIPNDKLDSLGVLDILPLKYV